MADTVTLPATGAVVGTDEVSIGGTVQQVQRVKLVDGTDGGTDLLPGSSARGLAVEPRTRLVRVQVTPTITAGAYAAADVVGGELNFANAIRVAGGTGEIRKVIVTDKAGLNPNLDLWLFDSGFSSPIADNAVWQVPAGELGNVVAGIPIYSGDWLDLGTTNAVGKPVAESVISDGTSLYGYLVTQDARTWVSTSDLSISLLIAQD